MRVLQVFKRLDMFELDKGFSAQHRVNTSAVVFLIAVLCTLVIYLVLWSQGIMLVYDITNEKSFDNIKNWIRNIEEVSVSVPNLSSGFKASAVCSTFLIYIIIRSYLHFFAIKGYNINNYIKCTVVQTVKHGLNSHGNAWTDQMYSLNALYFALDKCLKMQSCKYFTYLCFQCKINIEM